MSSYVELDQILSKINTLLDQHVSPSRYHCYGNKLLDLFALMHIRQCEIPILDPYSFYKHNNFYSQLSSNVDIQVVLKIKMILLIKKYKKSFTKFLLEKENKNI